MPRYLEVPNECARVLILLHFHVWLWCKNWCVWRTGCMAHSLGLACHTHTHMHMHRHNVAGGPHKMDAVKHTWVRERAQNGGCIQTHTPFFFFFCFYLACECVPALFQMNTLAQPWALELCFLASPQHVGWTDLTGRHTDCRLLTCSLLTQLHGLITSSTSAFSPYAVLPLHPVANRFLGKWQICRGPPCYKHVTTFLKPNMK